MHLIAPDECCPYEEGGYTSECVVYVSPKVQTQKKGPMTLSLSYVSATTAELSGFLGVDQVSVTITKAILKGTVVRRSEDSDVKVGLMYSTSNTFPSGSKSYTITPSIDGSYTRGSRSCVFLPCVLFVGEQRSGNMLFIRGFVVSLYDY